MNRKFIRFFGAFVCFAAALFLPAALRAQEENGRRGYHTKGGNLTAKSSEPRNEVTFLRGAL